MAKSQDEMTFTRVMSVLDDRCCSLRAAFTYVGELYEEEPREVQMAFYRHKKTLDGKTRESIPAEYGGDDAALS